MVARNRVRCTVVAVPVSLERRMSGGALARDVLPWADPYVAQLIRNLQDEVRRERRQRSSLRYRRVACSHPLPVDRNRLAGDGSSQYGRAW